MSINDIMTENTYHYYATDIKYMDESDNYYKLNENPLSIHNPWLTTMVKNYGSNLKIF